MKNHGWKDMREKVSRLLIKWSMPTRQAFLSELVTMWQEEVPCCGHECCCNKMAEEQEKFIKGFAYKKKNEKI